MADPSLTYVNKRTGTIQTNRFLFNKVKAVEGKLKARRIGVTSGRIIAEQTFGFWTDFFENHHYKIVRGRPIKLFKSLPSGFGRYEVLNELTKIRNFRNRINHNEPICFIGSTIDFSSTLDIHHSIQNIFTWINLELVSFIKYMDKVRQVISKAQTI